MSNKAKWLLAAGFAVLTLGAAPAAIACTPPVSAYADRVGYRADRSVEQVGDGIDEPRDESDRTLNRAFIPR